MRNFLQTTNLGVRSSNLFGRAITSLSAANRWQRQFCWQSGRCLLRVSAPGPLRRLRHPPARLMLSALLRRRRWVDRDLAAIVVEHEQADGGGEIAVLAPRI